MRAGDGEAKPAHRAVEGCSFGVTPCLTVNIFFIGVTNELSPSPASCTSSGPFSIPSRRSASGVGVWVCVSVRVVHMCQ